MRMSAIFRLCAVVLAALIIASISASFAASNQVAPSGRVDAKIPITANDLKPPACAALNLTSIVAGSGAFSGGGGSALILGSPVADTIRGQGGNDCILGGGGGDDLRGQVGSDVLLGGPGWDTLNGGNGTDACYGYSETISGGWQDTFSNCETIKP